MGLPVNPDSERAANLVPDIIRDLTTTRQKRLYPSGAKWVKLSYRLANGATGVTNQSAKVVVNAVSDADANGKMTLDGSFIPLFQGDDLTFSAPDASLITRIDVMTEQAVGAEKTFLRFLAGV